MSGKVSPEVRQRYRDHHRERLNAEARQRRAIRGYAVRITPGERFWSKVHRTETCWLWMGNIGIGGRYGAFYLDGRMRPAHRVAYEWLIGPVPHGLELDHLCRTPACVNPDHLEAVSHTENMRRGALRQDAEARGNVCVHGHVGFVERTSSGLLCRECRRVANRQYRARKT